MIGIEEIAGYIPQNRISNYALAQKYGLEESFIQNKIGVISRSVMGENESVLTMCLEAFRNLQRKIDVSNIDAVVGITQNPLYNIPHLSALLHKELGLSKNTACFDVALGCSGYVYGLSILQSFMTCNGFKRGLLFSADSYSKIIDENDKNTALLFGDGASVTLLGEKGEFHIQKTLFGSDGLGWDSLICQDRKLEMNGRQVFNFAATEVPKQITQLLDVQNLSDRDIDLYILHQGSRYIVQTIQKRLGVEESKVPYEILEYGNTISSSIPLILMNYLHQKDIKRIVLSGFGIGFSWASSILVKE